MLEMMRLETHTCATMDEVIGWFTAAVDAGKPPDVVFMDMQLADPLRVRAYVGCAYVCIVCVCVCVCLSP
jgi:hypothetical protein